MKVPNSFVPKKDLEKEVKRLLDKSSDSDKNSHYKLDNLIIERGEKNELEYFNKNLKLIKALGYKRNLFPWEYFGLLIDYFEQTLPVRYCKLAEDLLNSRAEWFSMAVKRLDDKLFCYANPKNIVWNPKGISYMIKGVLDYNLSLTETFSVKDLPSVTYLGIEKFGDDFIKYFYTRKFKDLPEEIKKEGSMFMIPPDGILWPIGSGNGKESRIAGLTFMASRGVKEINN